MLRDFLHLGRRFIQHRGQMCSGGHRTLGLWGGAALVLAVGLFGGPSANGATHASTVPEDPNSTPTATGTWSGALGAGSSQLHLLLTIRQSPSGEYTAELNSVDQGAVLPVESLTVQDHAIGFKVESVGGVYQGKLNDSGTDIDGTWTQARARQHLGFERSAASVAAVAPATASGPTEKPIFIPLDVRVPVPPTAFAADGKFHLVYELRVTNMGTWDCVLEGLEVSAQDAGSRSLASFSQANLEGMIRSLGVKAPEKSRLAPGASAVVYMWITLERREDVPAALRQRFSLKLGDYPQTLVLQTHPVAVGTNTLVISPPLKGDHWVAINGPSNTSSHRRALVPIDGGTTIAQRFAIDWVRGNGGDKSYHGDSLDNRNYYAYGAEILAVADGVVTETLDGVPQNVPGETHAVPITPENVGGNHVVLDIGDGHYAFYAHLQPGSLRVKLGDRVRRGEVIGLVGNTGNSSEPHLHFHISNATSPLGADGLPYALSSFEVQAQAQVQNGEIKIGKDGKAVREVESLPTEGEVVRFPATL
jgi:murein DD-endopeptidase